MLLTASLLLRVGVGLSDRPFSFVPLHGVSFYTTVCMVRGNAPPTARLYAGFCCCCRTDVPFVSHLGFRTHEYYSHHRCHSYVEWVVCKQDVVGENTNVAFLATAVQWLLWFREASLFRVQAGLGV